MSTELPKRYDPAEFEPKIREKWLASSAFHANPSNVDRSASPSHSGKRPPFSILIPPPNVTARLHIGHALNHTVQDTLIRAHRMLGYESLELPGTDHAGIATQTIVDKRLKEAGQPALADYKKKEAASPNTGRVEFIQKVHDWKDEYRQIITDQLKSLGCSYDWQRERFTMDEICAKAVREAFFLLFKEGLIYRGKRLVNWDPITQTALADDEVEMHDVDSFFWYLKYPVVDADGNETGDHVTVATTRPETYLGDTAVAVNPDDPERAKYIGQLVRLPFVGRIIPVIGDDYVVVPDPESSDSKAKYASGFLKVTPAHDPNDWEIGQRHNLEAINVMAPDASISDQFGWNDVGDAQRFLNLSRYDARHAVEESFKELGLLADKKHYTHAVGHSYRSHQPIEPYLSDQWYCKVSDDRLRGSAQRALSKEQRSESSIDGWRESAPGGAHGDDELAFFPPRYAKSYESWHDNLRDWCISRQLWWGHQIPVWFPTGYLMRLGDQAKLTEATNKLMGWASEGRISAQYRGEFVPLEKFELNDSELKGIFICVRDPDGRDKEIVEYLESIKYSRDPDVLDTWFSSALWPLSTMGWPDFDQTDETAGVFDAFNPTSVLCTGRDIITLWVSRMVMFNRHFAADARLPFDHVYIHPMIQDGHGQRMSKSLGNGVDPLDIIHTHGADAMRFALAQMATTTQDVRLPVDLICPHTDKTFEPKTTVTQAGHTVAAPVQESPFAPGKEMVTSYAIASGKAEPSDGRPLARNTSNKFDSGRNFITKLFNAARFALMNLETADSSATVEHADLSLTDKWMLARLAVTEMKAQAAIADYAFSTYAESMYDLLWRDFCDWYLEAIKPTVRETPAQQAVLKAALDSIVRMLHPICPHVTEVLHEAIASTNSPACPLVTLLDSPDGFCATAPWPAFAESLIDQEVMEQFDNLRAITEEARTTRAAAGVAPKRAITLHIPGDQEQAISQGVGLIRTLANLDTVTTDDPPADAARFTVAGLHFALSNLADEADAGAVKEQLKESIGKLTKDIAALEGRLSNKGYVERAPEHLVNETRDQLNQKKQERDDLNTRLESL